MDEFGESLRFDFKRTPSNTEKERITKQLDWLLAHTVLLEQVPTGIQELLIERFGLWDNTVKSDTMLAEAFGLKTDNINDIIRNSMADLQNRALIQP